MSELVFEVPGDPVAKGRPRIGRAPGGFVRSFTPAATVRFESLVRSAAAEAIGERAPLQGRARLTVKAVWTLPRSRWKKRAPVAEEHRTSRPDGDNVLKAVADALNGTAWLDDAQVVEATVTKWCSSQGEAGRTHVVVESLDHEWSP